MSTSGKRIKIGYGNDDEDPTAVVVSHNFWNEAPEDVLSEIFIRLPDCRSAVRSSTVSHLWHSLILHNPQFIPRFTSQHHQHGDPLFPYTIIFCKAELLLWPPPSPNVANPFARYFPTTGCFFMGSYCLVIWTSCLRRW